MEIRFLGSVDKPQNKNFAGTTEIPVCVMTSKIREHLPVLSYLAGSKIPVEIVIANKDLFGSREKKLTAMIAAMTVGQGVTISLHVATKDFVKSLSEMIGYDDSTGAEITVLIQDSDIDRIKEDEALNDASTPPANPDDVQAAMDEEAREESEEAANHFQAPKRGRGRPRKS